MKIKEDFLQLVWKYQYFDRKDLHTTSGQHVQLLAIGIHNPGEGPDFKDASLILDGVTLHGHVEIHRVASDWQAHRHTGDPAYDPVVLHVVWKEDQPIYRKDGSRIPTIELEGKIYLETWRKYEQLLDFNQELPCAHALDQVPSIIRFSALEKALVERLAKKTEHVHHILSDTLGDWEETAYRWLFHCFGFKTNSKAMEELAVSLPYKFLQKHRTSAQALEAMLFGQAGLLPDQSDEPYVQHLIREYAFYQKKFQWKSQLTRQHWSFKGVRPSNFPTLRLAQLAGILAKAPNLLQTVLEDVRDFTSFKRLLHGEISDYWRYHYTFGKSAEKETSKGISAMAIQLLTINYVAPLWFAYGRYFENPDWQERAFDLLQEVPAETNFIIRNFLAVSWKAENAFDSQGMIGLYRTYCQPKKCLQCKIAQQLLKADSRK